MDRTWFTMQDAEARWAFVDASTGNHATCSDFIEAILRCDCGVSFRATSQGIEYTLGRRSMYGKPQDVIDGLGLPIVGLHLSNAK